MKKVLTLLGSPRLIGNTAKVLSMFEENITADHEVERINLVEMNYDGCLGCYSCQGEMDAPGCVQEDDAEKIFEKMMAADAVVYASPLYCWGFSAQMKALLDRHFSLVKGYDTAAFKSLIDSKRNALLVTCGGPIEDNADLIQEAFERINDYVKARVVGKYILPFCTSPDAIGENGVELAKKLAEDIRGG